MSHPLAYFITFHCYGTWLQGDEPGWVDRHHNQVGTSFLPPDPEQRRAQAQKLKQPPYTLDSSRRALVMKAIRAVCSFRGWHLRAAHVRTTHVHCVVAANVPPEKVINDFKAYASRALNEAGLDPPGCQRWSRHGSTRYLDHEGAVTETVDYVLHRQGEPLTVYDSTSADPPLASGEPRP